MNAIIFILYDTPNMNAKRKYIVSHFSYVEGNIKFQPTYSEYKIRLIIKELIKYSKLQLFKHMEKIRLRSQPIFYFVKNDTYFLTYQLTFITYRMIIEYN